MQIRNISTEDIHNILISKLIGMAKTEIIVMTFAQWKEIITQRTETETHEGIHSLLSQITYLGIFQSTENKDTFCIGIFTGTKIPLGLINEWTQLDNLRIATPHTTNLPWIVFRPSKIVNEIEIGFIQDLINFTTQTYGNQDITIYSLTSNSSIINEEDIEDAWYWMYGDAIELVSEEMNIQTLMPIPGPNNNVLLVDRANSAHLYTFNPDIGELQRLAAPSTVI